MLGYLLEEQHTILDTCTCNLESILLNAHVEDDLAVKVVRDSLDFRISSDSLLAYMGLLNHLTGIHHTHGWEDCKPHLNHHAEKLDLIRTKYRNRLQVICKIYIYLREGQLKN